MDVSIIQPGAWLSQTVFKLPQAVDIAHFKLAWEATVASTQVLRTRLVQTEDHRVLQMVLGKSDIPWHMAGNLKDYLETTASFLMGYGDPLAHYAIVHEEGSTFFILNIHHSLYDGWSIPLMLQKMEMCYNGFVTKAMPTEVPFGRFIRHNMSFDPDAWRNFWKANLAGARRTAFPCLQFSSADLFPQATSKTSLSVPLPQRPASSITLSTTLRAAWAIILSRHAKSPDVTFGMFLTGRTAPIKDIESIIAPTIALVPIRITLSPSSSVPEFLAAVQAQATVMMPFEQAGIQNIRTLGPDAEAACAFDAMLIVHP